MSSPNRDVVGVLNTLIETCKDGEEGYRTAEKCVPNEDLKKLFSSYAQQRARFAAELKTEVERLGGTPEKTGSIAGAVRRGWTNIKCAVTGGDEAAVIAECEHGEDAAKAAYEKALQEHLPADVLAIVQRQYAGIKEAHDRIRALEIAAQHV